MIHWFTHILNGGNDSGSVLTGSGSGTGESFDSMHLLYKFDGAGGGGGKGIGMGFGYGYGTHAFLVNSPVDEFGSGEINWWEFKNDTLVCTHSKQR